MFFFFDPAYVMMQNPTWGSMIKSLNLVRQRYPKMTVGTLCTFLEIARAQKEIFDRSRTLVELSERLQIPYATLTRQTDKLGPGIGDQEGLGLLEKLSFGDNKKNKLVNISEDGKALLASIYSRFDQVSADERAMVGLSEFL